MPFVRPRVEIFQEFKNVVVSPVAPEFKVCLVGPCFDIQDYATNKSNLFVGNFIKSGVIDPPLCTASGTSSGRPDPGPFLTLTEPPQLRAGAQLDAASVNCYFDDVYIELTYGNAASIAVGSNVLTVDSSADLSNVKPGDRVVVHKPTATEPAVFTVVAVNNTAHTLTLNSIRKSSDTRLDNTNNRWRIEAKLDDRLITDVLTINENEITLVVPPTGIGIVYNDQTTPFLVNSAKIYIEYRALRTDLASLITINNTDEINAKLGTIDERNPLAVGAYTALLNTNTPVYVFGVESDDLAGHAGARDYLSSAEDIYAIVPLTDSLTAADWLSVINMWKQNCNALAQPEKSKFRIVIGSYHELPEYKNSAPPSTVGSTKENANDPVDVFACTDPTVDFSSVTTANLFDINGADLKTFSSQTATIFEENYAAKQIKGVLGSKRLRTSSSLASMPTSDQTDIFVRKPILVSEGGTAVLTGVSATVGVSFGKVTLSSAAFAGVVQAGDIIQVVGGTGLPKEGYSVESIASNTATLLYSAESASGTVTVNVYRSLFGAKITAFASNAGQLYVQVASGYTIPNNISAGDILIVFVPDDSSDTRWGVFAINSIDRENNRIYIKTYRNISTVTKNYGIAIYKGVVVQGGIAGHARRRLVYLEDLTAQFLSTVEVGEYIEIPFPKDVPGLIWDTTKNRWPIAEIVANERLRAQLADDEELAPKNIIAGFNGDCPYRIAIGLDKNKQIAELNSIISSYKDMRLIMCWPHEVMVSGVKNARTGKQNFLRGQYLAAAVGGQVASLPPHQSFTFLPISGITQLSGSSFYFTDDQLTTLRNGGWYVFVQDSEISPPYSIHEVTTDVSSYEFGELMHVKTFDYVSRELKAVLEAFKGRYNITTDTVEMIKAAILHRCEYLKNRRLSRLGAPLLSATLGLLAQTEADRLEIYLEIQLPHVLNQIGLHLQV